MCLGIPLQVHSATGAGLALCAEAGQADALRQVNTALLDTAPWPGDWLLVHMDVAVRALSAEEAGLIGDALAAVMAAADGKPFEHLIADLVDREPQLPEHLRPTMTEEASGHG